MRREPLDADEPSLESTARRFAGRARAGGHGCAWRPLGITVSADRLRLDQALGNLVDNALRYGEAAVLLSAAAEDGHVTLRVRDGGGPGFPPELVEHAFERFTRADRARSRGGRTGARDRRRRGAAHGGRAGAANREGGGAEVWIELPH